MTHDKKINYMRISAGICGFGFSYENLDLLVSLYETVIEKEGKTDLRDISVIEADVKARAELKNKKELLDKVEEKIKASTVG